MKKILILSICNPVEHLRVTEIFPNVAVVYEYMDCSAIVASPQMWQYTAQRVYRDLSCYDGIILICEMDMIPYVSSAVSFMIHNVNRCVVFTGMRFPMFHPLNDIEANLYTAILVVVNNIKGVTVACDKKVIFGTQAIKSKDRMGYPTLVSANDSYLAYVNTEGMEVEDTDTIVHLNNECSLSLHDELCTDVFLLKLIPGTKLDIFDALGTMYKGLVIEMLGVDDGIHGERVAEKISALTKRGVIVVLCGQTCCENNLRKCSKFFDSDVIYGFGMTPESAVVNLMWSLGQSNKSAMGVGELVYSNVSKIQMALP